ncbi:hypothetical protein [Vibrio sp. R78045]|uniref:hypothetical protein n=1 Tax=Vibrio sp. R78045 TaxID=3093868 RepID=UPI0036F384C2
MFETRLKATPTDKLKTLPIAWEEIYSHQKRLINAFYKALIHIVKGDLLVLVTFYLSTHFFENPIIIGLSIMEIVTFFTIFHLVSWVVLKYPSERRTWGHMQQLTNFEFIKRTTFLA